jgi:peroxiredoxin
MRLTGRLLVTFFLFRAASASAAVPDDPAHVMPLEVGAMAPAFAASEVDGRVFRFDPKNLKRPVLLISFRGGWCPFCNAHLQDLRTVEPQIAAFGYRVLFLSTDRPELSLKEKVNYHIVSDASMSAARAFGIAYRLDDAALKQMKTYGIDLEATQGNTNHELPVPSVFIVDRSGVIRFRYFNSDYRIRLDAAPVLAAAQAARHRPGSQQP